MTVSDTASTTATASLRFVLQRYFPYGGQQRDFLKIAQESVRRGHRVEALVQSWNGDMPAGITVVRLPTQGRSNHIRQQHFAAAVQDYRQQHPVDCQIGFIRMPALDFYFAADPCYRLKSTRKYGRWLGWLPRVKLLSELEAAVFSPDSTTKILALTEQSIADYRACYDTPLERFQLLPPAVAERFHAVSTAERQQLRNDYGLGADNLLLLMVGSHFKTKGVDRSIAALASLPPNLRQRCQLWVAGTGETKSLQQLAEQAGVAGQLRFLGGRDDVATLMQAADVLLQPSRTELAGMSIVEAISCQLPVIASGECGYGFHVRAAAAGLVLPAPFQQRDFNAALITALTDDQRSQWRQHAGRYGGRVDLYGMAKAAVDHIEQYLAARH